MNEIQRWCSCSDVPRGCVNRIRLWPLRRDDHSFVLIGAGGERRYDWPAHAYEKRSIARVQEQVAATDTAV